MRFEQFVFLALILSGRLASAVSSSTYATERIRPTEELRSRLECELILNTAISTVELGLDQNGITLHGTAHLGTYPELSVLLNEAGVANDRARKLANTLFEFHALAFATPSLRRAAEYFVKIMDRHEVVVCVLPPPGPDARKRGSDLYLSGHGRRAVIVLHTPTLDPSHFAIDFITSLSPLAGEDFLAAWLSAADRLRRQNGKAADKYARMLEDFASGDSGLAGDLFTDAFTQLYQVTVAAELFAAKYPKQAATNRLFVGEQAFEFLNSGPRAAVSSKFAQDLGLKPENVVERTIAMLTVMSETIAKAQTLQCAP